MIVPASVHQRFDEHSALLREVGQQVRDTVSAFCEREGFAFLARTKDLESLAEKLETGRYTRWSELDDLYACTVIVPTLSEEPRVLTFLETAFEAHSVKRKGGTAKPPDSFRFDATRFIGRLRAIEDRDIDPGRWTILFEVQVRTAFEHAWSVATHSRTYKGSSVDWKRLRLAAQLKAAVEQLDLFVLGFDASADLVSAHGWASVDGQARIAARMRLLIERQRVPSEVAPRDWTRFCENLYKLIFSSSTSPRRREEQEQFLSRALDAIENRLDGTSAEDFPRSISLLQYLMVLLLEENIVIPPLRDYTPLVTPELCSLFPVASRLDSHVDLHA